MEDSRWKHPKIQVGDIFPTNFNGDVKVIEYNNAKNIIIEFQDEYKHQKRVSAAHLRNGKATNPFKRSVCGIGYTGVGDYSHKSELFKTWCNMLNRCYNPLFLNKHPTYRDCYVCPEWHNFQNFAHWLFHNEFYGLGYQVDKDLLVQGNKLYSPDTCLLVPMKLNMVLIENTTPTRDLPTGVTYCKEKKKYAAQITMHSKHKLIGRFKTIDEAEAAYIKAKDAYIKEVADEFKGKIDERLYLVLMNWTASDRK